MKDLLLLLAAQERPFYSDEAQDFADAFDAHAGAVMHRDGYAVSAIETRAHFAPVDMDGGVVVEIDDDISDGDLESDVPSISLITEFGRTRMTWAQARALSVAIAEVEQIARRG